MPHQISTAGCNGPRMTDGIVKDKLDSSRYVETEKEDVEIGRWSVKGACQVRVEQKVWVSV